MKILVTGGAGFIASHIVDAYINQGHQVAIIDNLSSGKKANINPQAKFFHVDINSPKIPDIFSSFKPQILNHHAAQINVRVSVSNPKLDAKTNIIGFINLLQAAHHTNTVKHTIFASTGGAMYGDTHQVPTPESHPPQPISPYGISKRTGELYLEYYHHIHRISYTALRYSNVYGPRQNAHGEAGVVAIFYSRTLHHQPFTINGNGSQTRDFVYVDDVVSANLLATKKCPIGIYNIATATQTTVNNLIHAMQATIDHQGKISHGLAKSGEVQISCLSFSKAQKELKWQPRYSLQQGLQHTAAFFKQNS